MEERKLVTALFADLAGSTALGERLDPERLRSLLNAYFSAMSAVIESWGGTIEKFIGDAIMAVFGVPVAREDDAERAIRAAFDMLQRLATLNPELERRHGETLSMRIGVNTGEVLAGGKGPVDQMIATGDAVNVAARLQAAADPGTILAGERTCLATRDGFRFGEARTLELKGKTEPVAARPVLTIIPGAGRRAPRLKAPMIGRDAELEMMFKALAEAGATRRPKLILLKGSAGIGKSRLVLEFTRRAGATIHGTRVLTGRCLAAGRGITYWPLVEILRSCYGISLDDPPSVAEDKLTSGIPSTLAPLSAPEAETERITFALATTAGISVRGNPLDRAQPQSVADELAWAWPRYLSGLAIGGPVLLVIEDVHWAADPLLDMLVQVRARTEGPLLLLVTARPDFAERKPRLATDLDASEIDLFSLSDQESELLVQGLLDVRELPEELSRAIHRRAEGNPFFVEELIQRLIDEGAVVSEGGGWRTTPAAASVSLPDSIQALLAARLDALGHEEKRVMQEASVVGRVFWEGPLARSIGGGVSGALRTLERGGFVVTRPVSTLSGEVEYSFRHALVRDVAYASLTKARRAQAHAEVAGWIETLVSGREEELIELVAHHYGEAVSGEGADLAWGDDQETREAVRAKALKALIAAGTSLRRRFATEQAVELHTKALAITQDVEERLRVIEALGDDHATAWRGDEGFARYGEALEMCRVDPDRAELLARIVAKAGKLGERFGSFKDPPTVDALDQLIEEGIDHAPADDGTRARLLALRGMLANLHVSRGSTDPVARAQRLAWAEEGLAIAERLGDAELISETASYVGLAAYVAGDRVRAWGAQRRRMELIDDIPSKDERLGILEFAAQTAAEPEEPSFDEMFAHALRMHEEARGVAPHLLLHATSFMVNGAFYLGRWREVDDAVRELKVAFRDEQDLACPLIRGGLQLAALLEAGAGRNAEAQELLATPTPHEADSHEFAARYRAMYLVRHDDHRRGLDLARTLIARPSTTSPEPYIAELEALAIEGEWTALREAIERARAKAASLDSTVMLLAHCDVVEARLVAEGGDPAGAGGALARAVSTFDRLRMAVEAAVARERLATYVGPDEADRLRTEAAGAYERAGAAPGAGRVHASRR